LMTVQMFAFAVLLVSASAQADECVAGNIDNSDTFDAVGLLQTKTKIILQADRDKIANDEVDEASNTETNIRKAPYTVGTYGQKHCPSNTIRVTSQSECSGKVAASLGKKFGGASWLPAGPKGCLEKKNIGYASEVLYSTKDYPTTRNEFAPICIAKVKKSKPKTGGGVKVLEPVKAVAHVGTKTVIKAVKTKEVRTKAKAPVGGRRRGASKKGSKKAAVDKVAKAAKQAAADKAVADASTSLRTDLKELTSTKEDFEKELKTLETHIAQTETTAQAVKSMAKNAAAEMAAALKAVKEAKDEELAAKDKEALELAKKHELHAAELVKIAEGHKADADKAIKDLGKHQKLAKAAETARNKEAANKNAAASTAAEKLATKTQEAADLAKAAAKRAKEKADKDKVAADEAAK